MSKTRKYVLWHMKLDLIEAVVVFLGLDALFSNCENMCPFIVPARSFLYCRKNFWRAQRTHMQQKNHATSSFDQNFNLKYSSNQCRINVHVHKLYTHHVKNRKAFYCVLVTLVLVSGAILNAGGNVILCVIYSINYKQSLVTKINNAKL